MHSVTGRRGLKLALLGLALTATGASAHAQVYDATTDFTATSTTNPNGVWRYGYLEPTTNKFILYPAFLPTPGLPEWCDPDHLTANAPLFWKNLTGGTRDGVADGQVSLHPGPTAGSSPFDDASVVRFRVPTTGSYNVSATFYAGDFGDTEAWIVKRHNLAQPLAHFASTGSNPAWQKTLSLTAGTVLEFIVGHSTDGFTYDNTPLSIVITKR